MPESLIKPEDQMMQWITSKWISNGNEVFNGANAIVHRLFYLQVFANIQSSHPKEFVFIHFLPL